MNPHTWSFYYEWKFSIYFQIFIERTSDCVRNLEINLFRSLNGTFQSLDYIKLKSNFARQIGWKYRVTVNQAKQSIHEWNSKYWKPMKNSTYDFFNINSIQGNYSIWNSSVIFFRKYLYIRNLNGICVRVWSNVVSRFDLRLIVRHWDRHAIGTNTDL